MRLKFWTRKDQKQEAPPVERSTEPTNTRVAGLLSGRHPGPTLRRGPLEMIPLFGSPVKEGLYAAPQSALQLQRAVTYGTLVFHNRSNRPTVVPLHVGYLQRGVQNHAMSEARVLKGGETRTFENAACIQAAQGGYLREVDHRFIMLPHQLRGLAYQKRGERNYSKLWSDIERFNHSLDLKQRGHLDELKQHYQAELLRCTYHLEPAEGQTGAVFLFRGQVMGIEVAPDAAFYRDLHRPLVMYCYGPLRIQHDRRLAPFDPLLPALTKVDAKSMAGGEREFLADLRARYGEVSAQREEASRGCLEHLASLALKSKLTHKTLGHQVFELEAGPFLGQGVFHREHPAYLSLFNAQVLGVG